MPMNGVPMNGVPYLTMYGNLHCSGRCYPKGVRNITQMEYATNTDFLLILLVDACSFFR